MKICWTCLFCQGDFLVHIPRSAPARHGLPKKVGTPRNSRRPVGASKPRFRHSHLSAEPRAGQAPEADFAHLGASRVASVAGVQHARNRSQLAKNGVPFRALFVRIKAARTRVVPRVQRGGERQPVELR
jgi:hypothetical protein